MQIKRHPPTLPPGRGSGTIIPVTLNSHSPRKRRTGHSRTPTETVAWARS